MGTDWWRSSTGRTGAGTCWSLRSTRRGARGRLGAARPGGEPFRALGREGSPVEAVAALYVYEAQVPEIAAKKIEGLRRFYGVSEPKGLAYFAGHEQADGRHRAAWRRWP